MSSMRIDGGASAKLWAKRLAKLIECIEEDGGSVHINVDRYSIAVQKDSEMFDVDGNDVTKDLQ